MPPITAPNQKPAVTATDPPKLATQYPHVEGVADWRAQQSLRLLWDRVFDHEARLQGAEGTQATLVTTANDHAQQIALADRQGKEALAGAQLTAPEVKARVPSEPSSGPGSSGDPLIPMSSDPLVIEGNIKASLYHWNRADYSYWSNLVHQATAAPWQGGDGKWYIGWDAYFEARANPADAGSASHDLLPLPAVYTTAPPAGYPTGGWT